MNNCYLLLVYGRMGTRPPEPLHHSHQAGYGLILVWHCRLLKAIGKQQKQCWHRPTLASSAASVTGYWCTHQYLGFFCSIGYWILVHPPVPWRLLQHRLLDTGAPTSTLASSAASVTGYWCTHQYLGFFCSIGYWILAHPPVPWLLLQHRLLDTGAPAASVTGHWCTHQYLGFFCSIGYWILVHPPVPWRLLQHRLLDTGAPTSTLASSAASVTGYWCTYQYKRSSHFCKVNLDLLKKLLSLSDTLLTLGGISIRYIGFCRFSYDIFVIDSIKFVKL